MKGNGKKMFPGKNESNIFFVDKEKKINVNLNPNNYINKNNNTNINKTNIENYSNLKNRNSNKKHNINQNKLLNYTINENRTRHMSIEIFKPNSLKKNKNSNLPKENQNNKRKVLYTERSVDFLRPRRVLGNFSTRNYILNKNNIWDKNLSLDNNINNLLTSRESKPLKKYSSFSQNETENEKNKTKKINPKLSISTNDHYYNKFINKPNLNGQNKNNKNQKIINLQKNKKSNIINNNNIAPKEQEYIIKKENPDNNLIDIKELKKKFSENGVNIISISGLSSSLVPINNDTVKIIVNSNDIKSKKFNNIEKYMKNKGLEFNEVKKNYHIKFTRGIYPNKSNWKDITYGGREKFEKIEMSSKFQKDQKEKKFHKKNLLSKNNFYDVKYKNNFEIKPKRYNSVEK